MWAYYDSIRSKLLDSKASLKKKSVTLQFLLGCFCGNNNLLPHGSAFLSRHHKDTSYHPLILPVIIFLLPKRTKNILLFNPFTCLYISTLSLFIFTDTTYPLLHLLPKEFNSSHLLQYHYNVFFFNTAIGIQFITLWKNSTRNFMMSLLSLACIFFSLPLNLSFTLTGLLENFNFYHSYWWRKLALQNSLQVGFSASLSTNLMIIQLQLISKIKKLLEILLNLFPLNLKPI